MKMKKEAMSLIVTLLSIGALVLLEAPYWTLVLILSTEISLLLIHHRVEKHEESKVSLDIEAYDPKELEMYKKDLIIASGIPLGYMTTPKEITIPEELSIFTTRYKGQDFSRVDPFAELQKEHKKEDRPRSQSGARKLSKEETSTVLHALYDGHKFQYLNTADEIRSALKGKN